MSTMRNWKTLIWTGAIVLATVLLAVVISACLAREGKGKEKGNRADYPITFAIIATGVVTFFGVLKHQLENDGGPTTISDGSLRIALTVSLTMTYFVFVGYTTYYEGTTSEVATSTVTSFTTIVGVVIAFYFGASAYIQVNSPVPPKNDGDDPSAPA
jgi:hypothetical protein